MTRLSDHANKRIRIRDIAEMTGVSIGTVDRVLHNRGEVGGETYERVMSVVRELGYTPNLLAKSLALKNDFHISVVLPEADEFNAYWGHPLTGIVRARLELKDYNTHISVNGYDQRQEASFRRTFDKVLAGRPQGIVLAPHFQDAASEYLKECGERQIPVILVDADVESGNRLAYFGQDARQSGEVAAHLIYTAMPEGARVLILKLAWNKTVTRHIRRRVEGFMDFSLRHDMKNIRIDSAEIDLAEAGEPALALERLFTEGSEIRGVFVPNSRVHKVAAMLERIHRKGIFLLGYDLMEENIRYLRSGTIDMLICQKPEEQGYRSVMALYNHLLTRMPVTDIQPSPIDILIKENLDSYIHSNYTTL